MDSSTCPSRKSRGPRDCQSSPWGIGFVKTEQRCLAVGTACLALGLSLSQQPLATAFACKPADSDSGLQPRPHHSLARLGLGPSYNRLLPGWIAPPALREVHFGTLFDQSLADAQLLDTLRALIFGASFSQCIRNVRLSPPLQQLFFGNNFTGGGCRLPSSRWPVSLRHLRSGGLFSLTPGAASSLPNCLMHLHLWDRCNWSLQQIGLPAELQHLELGYSLDQPICNIRWPLRLPTLTFGMAFNRPLQDVLLPATLCELHFGNRFDQALDGIRWPSQMRLLHFGSDFNHSLATANLSDQLETLVLGQLFRQDLRYVPLPQSLLRLTLGECLPLERHPLEELSIKRPFLNVLVDVTFPETLRKLDCDGDILEV